MRITEQEMTLSLDDRFYRIRGLQKNANHEQMKINLLVKRGEHFHVDNLDIYSARHRAAYIKQAAIELGYQRRQLKTRPRQVVIMSGSTTR